MLGAGAQVHPPPAGTHSGVKRDASKRCSNSSLRLQGPGCCQSRAPEPLAHQGIIRGKAEGSFSSAAGRGGQSYQLGGVETAPWCSRWSPGERHVQPGWGGRSEGLPPPLFTRLPGGMLPPLLGVSSLTSSLSGQKDVNRHFLHVIYMLAGAFLLGRHLEVKFLGKRVCTI